MVKTIIKTARAALKTLLNFLFNKNFVTNRAVRAFREAIFCTSSRLCLVNNNCMPGSGITIDYSVGSLAKITFCIPEGIPIFKTRTVISLFVLNFFI